MTKPKNPRPTLPTWRASAPFPEEPVAEAEADAPVADAEDPFEPPVVVASVDPKVAVAELLLPVAVGPAVPVDKK